MVCPNCGMECDDSENVCGLCGYQFEVTDETAETQLEQEPVVSEQPAKTKQATVSKTAEKKNSSMIIVIILLVVVVIGLATVVIMLAMDKDSDKNNNSSNTASVSETAETEIKEITDKAADIKDDSTTESTKEDAEKETEDIVTEKVTIEVMTEAVTEAPAQSDGIDYVQMYGSMLEQANIRYADAIYRYYTLFDIDSNGVYELIMKNGTCEADAKYEIWSTVDGETIFCGELGGGSAYLSQQDGILYWTMTRQGFQTINQIGLYGYEIMETEYFTSDGMMEEYISIGKDVSFIDYSDPMILEAKTATQ